MQITNILGTSAINAHTQLLQQSTPIREVLRAPQTTFEAAPSPTRYVDQAPPFSPQQKASCMIDPDRVYQIVLSVIEQSPPNESRDAYFERLKNSLKEAFPFIDITVKRYTNTYHGVTGDIYILYASFSEYMILFGTEHEQTLKGFSGNYFRTEFRTIVVEGEQITNENGHETIYKVGDRSYLAPSHDKIYELRSATREGRKQGGWIIECARGWLWLAMFRFLFENKWKDIKGQIGAVFRGVGHAIRGFFRRLFV